MNGVENADENDDSNDDSSKEYELGQLTELLIPDIEEGHSEYVHEDVSHHVQQVLERKDETLFNRSDCTVLKLVTSKSLKTELVALY